MNEQITREWRPVVGYEGRYEVSNDGLVVSLASQERFRRKTDLILTQFLTGCPGRKYPSVNLVDNHRKAKTWRVHKLVAAAFLGKPPSPGLLVLHFDDDQLNNSLENLRYGTLADNQRDSVRNGRHHLAKKTHCLRGHPLSGRNLISRKGGGRGCRECERLRDRARYQRRKAA